MRTFSRYAGMPKVTIGIQVPHRLTSQQDTRVRSLDATSSCDMYFNIKCINVNIYQRLSGTLSKPSKARRSHVGGLPSGQESLRRRPSSAHPRLVRGRESKLENTASATAASAANAKSDRRRATTRGLPAAPPPFSAAPSCRPTPPPSKEFFLITKTEPTAAEREREEGHGLSVLDGKRTRKISRNPTPDLLHPVQYVLPAHL